MIVDTIRSIYNHLLTLDYMVNEEENKYFDRKSAKIKPNDLAPLVSAFANAQGGTIVIGISDKDRIIEGIDHFSKEKINEFIAAPKNYCKPMPQYKEEFIEVTNDKGDKDHLLLLHIEASVDTIIRTNNDSTYLRIADKTKELKGEDLLNLEYAKNTRHYEDEINLDATIADLDEELLLMYSDKIGAQNLSFEDILKARNFIKIQNGKEYLTNAAVLLFAKNIYQFYPNCRVRFVRYDGNSARFGTNMNIIKDVSIEHSITRLIPEAIKFISTQLRDFTALDPSSGQFKTVPEYPEFAWMEGIVNAITHREYAMSGAYILVTMYDDRLEIQSPGKLPNIVTIDNIKDTRYARNPRISRVLTELNWVRELNEGVKRIYADMKSFYLNDPLYLDKEQYVTLVLKNSIETRMAVNRNTIKDKVPNDIWNSLDELERNILVYLSTRKHSTRKELEEYFEKSANTIRRRLRHLIKLDMIKMVGEKYGPNVTYEIII